MRLPAPLLMLVVLAVFGPATARDRPAVDINIVVGLDRSESISEQEAYGQVAGLAYSLTDPQVQRAMTSGYHGRVGLIVITWSSFEHSDIILPWTLIQSAGDAEATAATLLASGNPDRYGTQTDIALGIRRAVVAMEAAPFTASRQILNLVSDGIDNFGRLPTVDRDVALSRGITINALTMGRGSAIRVLRRFYQNNVIGGPLAFVHNTTDGEAFAEAMVRKMLLEIASAHRLDAARRGGAR